MSDQAQQTTAPVKTVLVSAVALIDKEGRILLAQRPEGKSMAGLWEFPGG
jgi:8-oxo-dGTP diphosphatase